MASELEVGGLQVADGSNDVAVTLGNSSYGMALDYSTGVVSIKTNTVNRLDVGNTGQTTITSSNQNVLYVNRQTSNGDVIVCEYGGVDRLRLGTEGITFPNGGNAPTAAANNQLDYYGEGIFTPTVRGSTTAGSYSISTTIGRYTRIGNVVTVNVSLINITENTAGSGNLEVGGLPFQSIASSTQGFVGSTRFRRWTDAGSSPVAVVQGSSQAVKFVQYVSGGDDDFIDISGVDSGYSDISFSLTYFV